MRRTLVALTVAASTFVVASTDAHAGGLQVSDRGVRPLGRGGAFVAGADDLGAAWYNPAGLADAGTSVLVDSNVVLFHGEFTRHTLLTDAEGRASFEQVSPTVTGSNAFLPIPTLAGSYAFGDKKQYTIAAGVMGPQAIVPVWPDDGAQRYSIIDQKGSALAFVGVHFAWKPVEWLQVGAGPVALTGFYSAAIAFNANPKDRLLGAPEDRNYDSVGQNNAGFIFAPGANGGVIVTPHKYVRIGVSVQSPITVNTPAELLISLPSAAPFDEAYVQGAEARLRFKLPWVFRFGVEARPDDNTRIEVAFTRDLWSRTQGFDVDVKDVNIYNIKGFPSPFGVQSIAIPLNFHDTTTYRLGGEYRIRNLMKVLDERVDLQGRMGVAYDEAAAPPEYLSPITFDTDRVHLSFGGSLYWGEHVRLDALYMHSFFIPVDVDPRTAAVPGINPVRGNPTPVMPVNAGHYEGHINTIGVGANYRFD